MRSFCAGALVMPVMFLTTLELPSSSTIVAGVSLSLLLTNRRVVIMVRASRLIRNHHCGSTKSIIRRSTLRNRRQISFLRFSSCSRLTTTRRRFEIIDSTFLVLFSTHHLTCGKVNVGWIRRYCGILVLYPSSHYTTKCNDVESLQYYPDTL